jgi:hypothetical protein
MIFDFISIFNTIHPQQMVLKLSVMQVDLGLVAGYVTNNGAPQETILSPFLPTLSIYRLQITADYRTLVESYIV